MSDRGGSAAADGDATVAVAVPQPPALREVWQPPQPPARPRSPGTTTTAADPLSESPAVPMDDHDDAAAAAASAAEGAVHVVADLKSELYHATRTLLQVRQQARTSDETCAELRQRCQALESEKQALRRELQEAHERMQARQSRLDEHRREAADAKLAVLSLTAERDELAARLQEAWDRVTELGVTLRGQEARTAQLETDVTAARHGAELVTQQRSHVEAQLRLLQERLRAQEADGHVAGAAQRRLLTSLQAALQQLAGLLSGVAYDYQQSLAQDAAEAEAEAEEAAKEAGDAAVASITAGPHVVLSSVNVNAATPSETPAADALVRRRGAAGGGGEAARLRAEGALHDAEAALLGDVQAATTAALSPTPEDSAAAAANAAGTTPPERRPSPPWQALVQGDRVHAAQTVSSAKDGGGAAAEEEAAAAAATATAVRAAVTPVLLALKHVAAMLSSVRLERRRWTAECAHLHRRCAALQRELEAAQRSGAARERDAADVRGRLAAVQRRAEQAEAALLECRQEDARRRGALAQTLDCLDDWALVQHSVQLLRVRQAELHKDVHHLEAQQRSAPPPPPSPTHAHGEEATSAEGVAPSAAVAAAEVRYEQLEQQYHALKEWVETRWTAASTQPSTATAAPAPRHDIRGPPAASPPPPAASGATSEAERQSRALESPPPLKPARAPTSGAVTTPPRRSSSAWLHRSAVPPPAPMTAAALVDSPAPPHRSDARQAPAPAPAGHVRRAGETRLRATPSSSSSATSTSASSVSSASAEHDLSHRADARNGVVLPHPRDGIAYAAGGVGSSDVRHPPPRPAGVASVSAPLPPPPPLSTAYPAPQHSAAYLASQPVMSGAAAVDTEQVLLASLYRDHARARLGAAAMSPEVRNPYGVDAVDYASLFATEVLHVIEALDRRVSGALHRGPSA